MVTEYHGLHNLSKIINQLPVKFIAGRLCLDFVNTVGGRDAADAVIRDKLASYEELLAWSVLAGCIGRRRAGILARQAAREPRQAAAILGRAVRLREALYGLFKSAVGSGKPPLADANAFRAELAIARAHQELTALGCGFAWTFAESPAALDRILWPVALSAGDLLTSADLPRLRQCACPECGWLFLDTSRNHRRQWCDMQDCGNRAKVRRWRQRIAGRVTEPRA